MAVQNGPQGCNAFRDIRQSLATPRHRLLMAFTGLVLLGPIAAVIGRYLLVGADAMLGWLMLVAAVGICVHYVSGYRAAGAFEPALGPPFGAVPGFLVGVLGHMALGV